MARTVDTSWIDTYQQVKALFTQEGTSSAPSTQAMAEAVGMKPKTLVRLLTAGRYLDTQAAEIAPQEVRCGYVQLEMLEKISRIDPSLAHELLPGVLANRIKRPELTEHLENARQRQPLLAHAINQRALKKRVSQGLSRDIEQLLDHLKTDYFGVRDGAVFKSTTPSGTGPLYYIQATTLGDISCLIFGKSDANWQDPSRAALEIYDQVCARRTLAKGIWIVFKSDNAVLRHLAELCLWFGGSPLDEHWLRLGFLTEQPNQLNVLFEDYFTPLAVALKEGRSLYRRSDLCWNGAATTSEHTIQMELYTIQALPEPAGSRTYDEYLYQRWKARMDSGEASHYERGQVLENDLGI